MDFEGLQGDPEFRSWLERLIEDKVREEFDREKEKRFRESFALLSVRSDCLLAKSIARHLGKALVEMDLMVFGDCEKKAVIKENLRGKQVYVMATIGRTEDPDVSLANTLKVISALRRTCKVPAINIVAPCLWYQAQDKTHSRREPISVRDVADDLTRRGMDHIIVMALHAEQIEIAFDSFDHLKMEPLFGDYLKHRFAERGKRVVLISPDDGGVRMREELYKNMDPEWVDGQAAVHQVRERGGVDEKNILDFVGNVEGKVGVILDDMMRSGTTMFQAAAAAKKFGAKRVIGVVTHFYGFGGSGKTFEERLAASQLDELVCTNSRGGVLERVRESSGLASRVTVLDISRYLALAIRNYHTGGTVKDMIYRLPDRQELYEVAHQATGST